ncbi:MAG: hypothetical protein WDW38_009959 [Sanguina aurantia]
MAEASPQLSYITAESLAKVIKSQPELSDCLIIDVRGDDYAGGHIKGALNAQSQQFNDQSFVDEVIKTHVADKSLVVLHCAFSQQRGPRCALHLKQRLLELGMDDSKVQVLRGGFNSFAQQYSSDPQLVEDWDATVKRD